MRGVQFNQVETGFTRIRHGLAEIVNNPRDLVQFKSARHRRINADRIAVFIAQRGAGVRAQGRGGNRCLTARLDAAVRDTTGMPQLDGNTTLFSVNASRDFFPRGNLFRAVQTWCASVTLSLSRNLGGLGDDQARACALTVIFTHQRGRDITRLNAAQTGKRGHEHTVWRGNGTHFQGGK